MVAVPVFAEVCQHLIHAFLFQHDAASEEIFSNGGVGQIALGYKGPQLSRLGLQTAKGHFSGQDFPYVDPRPGALAVAFPEHEMLLDLAGSPHKGGRYGRTMEKDTLIRLGAVVVHVQQHYRGVRGEAQRPHHHRVADVHFTGRRNPVLV